MLTNQHLHVSSQRSQESSSDPGMGWVVLASLGGCWMSWELVQMPALLDGGSFDRAVKTVWELPLTEGRTSFLRLSVGSRRWLSE